MTRHTGGARRVGVSATWTGRSVILLAASLLAAGIAWAATYYPGGTAYSQSDIQGFFSNSSNAYLRDNAATFAQMSMFESGGTGNTGIYNGSCCTGLMQMNNRNIQDFAGMSKQDFAQLSGQQQVDVYTKYFNSIENDAGIKQLKQMQANGQTLGGQAIDGNTIAACAQLGTGNCRAAIANGCTSTANGSGGDGSVNVCSMAARARGGTAAKSSPSGNCQPAAGTTGDGSDSSSADATTNEQSAACKQQASANKNLNKTSRTCQPTVAMLQATPCEQYPSSLQAFCFQYKPKLMNMQECQAAEKYAQGAPKGSRQQECENQTFGSGTGSWSYVLACSGTKRNQGTEGKKPSETGQKTDANGNTTGGTADQSGTDSKGGTVANIDKVRNMVGGGFQGQDSECAALVQSTTNVGYTGTWKPGEQVLGGENLQPGTVIATFQNGKYTNTSGQSHVMIFDGYGEGGSSSGFWAIEQFKKSGGVIRTFYPAGKGGAEGTANYSVVTH